MSLKEYLINMRNKLTKNQKAISSDQVETIEEDYINPNNEKELNEVLTSTINDFFPTTGHWSSSCFERPNENLQSNLRDNSFLAKRIQQKASLPDNYYNKVLAFIASSELFKQKLHEYEQRIVKWQIQFIANGGENWICDEKLGGDVCLILPQCDIAFRKGVVDTLTAIGINLEAIEEGLEKNADMWRNSFIERAFRVQYEPVMINIFRKESLELLPAANLEHKQAWIKMRKYEYYCNHKRSVDLYGTVESEMLLTKEEVTSLKSYLKTENAKRLDFIEQYKKSNAKTKKLVPNN